MLFEPVTPGDVRWKNVRRIEKPKAKVVQYGGRSSKKRALEALAQWLSAIRHQPAVEDRVNAQHGLSGLETKPRTPPATTIEMAVGSCPGWWCVWPLCSPGGRAMEIVMLTCVATSATASAYQRASVAGPLDDIAVEFDGCWSPRTREAAPHLAAPWSIDACGYGVHPARTGRQPISKSGNW